MPKCLYTKSISEEILDRLSEGESLKAICRSEGMPSASTVFGWVKDDKEGFADQYARAREIQCDLLFDDLSDLSRKALEVAHGAPGTGEAGAKVQAIKVEIDTLKWILAKRFPERWAERVKTENTTTSRSEVSLTPELSKEIERIQKIKAKIDPPSYKSDEDDST